jgi:hypothetical protein
MVVCSACGKTMEKVPDWMRTIEVQFVCNNCPKRQTQNIAFVNLEPTLPASAKLEPTASPVEDKEEDED